MFFIRRMLYDVTDIISDVYMTSFFGSQTVWLF